MRDLSGESPMAEFQLQLIALLPEQTRRLMAIRKFLSVLAVEGQVELEEQVRHTIDRSGPYSNPIG
jgi:hypothetical protein